MVIFVLSTIKFDLDGDGSITTEELRHAMTKLLGEQTTKTEIEQVVREADKNGDGTVDFEGERQTTHTHTHTHTHTYTRTHTHTHTDTQTHTHLYIYTHIYTHTLLDSKVFY